MNTSNWMKRFAAIVGSALLGLMFAAGANAANPEPVPVEVEFVNPITITEVNSLKFGLLDVNLANLETVIIAPDDSLTDAGSNVLGSTQEAAEVTVAATIGKSITILVDNITPAPTGYTLGTWMCNYDGAGSDSACDGAGYSETSATTAALLVGVTLTGNGSAVVGADNTNFDVTISYQ